MHVARTGRSLCPPLPTSTLSLSCLPLRARHFHFVLSSPLLRLSRINQIKQAKLPKGHGHAHAQSGHKQQTGIKAEESNAIR